jgi:hypothetical protein
VGKLSRLKGAIDNVGRKLDDAAQMAARQADEAARKSAGLDSYDRAMLSARYPDTGPPQMLIDKNKGTEYPGKLKTPSELALEAERIRIDKDVIKRGKYTPYFDASERHYADATKYNIQGDTLIDAMPKKEATVNKYRDMFDTPQARKKLNDAYDAAKGTDAEQWYAMGQLQDEYIRHLGPDEGARRFKSDFADAMAATTGGANPGQNFLMAAYGNHLKAHDLATPSNSYAMPHPVGGRYAGGNMALYDKFVREGQEITAAGNPKRFNFRNNFLGDTSRATIDEQMSRLMIGQNAPPGASYGIVESILVDEAKRRGIPAAEFQDVAWAGAKGSPGKPMIQWVNESIARTSEVTGLPQEDVVRNWIVNRSPMYGLPVAVGAGALLGSQNADASVAGGQFTAEDYGLPQEIYGAYEQFAQRRSAKRSIWQKLREAGEFGATVGSALAGGIVSDLSRVGGYLNPFMPVEQTEAGASAIQDAMQYMPRQPNAMLEGFGNQMGQFMQDIEPIAAPFRQSIPYKAYEALPERAQGIVRVATDFAL